MQELATWQPGKIQVMWHVLAGLRCDSDSHLIGMGWEEQKGNK